MSYFILFKFLDLVVLKYLLPVTLLFVLPLVKIVSYCLNVSNLSTPEFN